MYKLFDAFIEDYCVGFRWDSTNLQTLCNLCLPGWRINHIDRSNKRNGTNGAASINSVKHVYELITNNNKRYCYSLSPNVLAKIIVDLWNIKNSSTN